jgi:hypothetical protein
MTDALVKSSTLIALLPLALGLNAACSAEPSRSPGGSGGSLAQAGGQPAAGGAGGSTGGEATTGGAPASGGAGGLASGGATSASGGTGGGTGGAAGATGGVPLGFCDALAVANLLEPYRCHECHFQVDGILREYDSVPGLNAVVGAETARGALSQCGLSTIVVPGAPESSLLYVKLSGTQPLECGDQMPKKQGAQEQKMLAAEELECVAEWITSLGAAGAGGAGGSAGSAGNGNQAGP